MADPATTQLDGALRQRSSYEPWLPPRHLHVQNPGHPKTSPPLFLTGWAGAKTCWGSTWLTSAYRNLPRDGFYRASRTSSLARQSFSEIG